MMSSTATHSVARTFVAGTRPAVIVTLLAVTIAGSVVAQRGRPVFWLFTIAVLLIVLRGATPPAGSVLSLAHLPSRLQELIMETLALLPAGESQTHLRSIVRIADAALAIPDRDFEGDAERDLRERVVELVEVCCEASRGLSRVEAAWPAGVPVPVPHAGAVSAARATYVHQLQDATATLERLTLSVTQRDAEASERISALAADIRREIAAREHAMAELHRLLAP